MPVKRAKKSKKRMIGWMFSIGIISICAMLFVANYLVESALRSVVGGNSEQQQPHIQLKNELPDNSSLGQEVSALVDIEELPDSPQQEQNEIIDDAGENTVKREPRLDISETEAEELADAVTATEKAKVLGIMIKNLSANDLNWLRELVEGGLTSQEKLEARTLMLERLSEDEYNELIAIAHKHGVSQGRTYQEVKNEGQ